MISILHANNFLLFFFFFFFISLPFKHTLLYNYSLSPFAFRYALAAGTRSNRGQHGVYILQTKTTTLNGASEKQKDEKGPKKPKIEHEKKRKKKRTKLTNTP